MLTDHEARELLGRAAATIGVPAVPAPASGGGRSRLPLVAAAVLAAAVGVGGIGLSGGSGDAPTAVDDPSAATPTAAPGPRDLTAYPREGPDEVTELAAPMIFEGTGTQTVELGPAPAGATGVSYRIACLTPGRFVFPAGGVQEGSVECTEEDTRLFLRDPDALGAGGIADLAPGQTSIVIGGEPGTRWRVVATYVEVVRHPGETVDPEELRRQLEAESVPYRECTEMVAFFERPDVVAFYVEHLGPERAAAMSASADSSRVGLPCPTTAQLEAGFARLQRQAASGKYPPDLPTRP